MTILYSKTKKRGIDELFYIIFLNIKQNILISFFEGQKIIFFGGLLKHKLNEALEICAKKNFQKISLFHKILKTARNPQPFTQKFDIRV